MQPKRRITSKEVVLLLFSDETERSVIAHVSANLQAMRFWALQYAPYVTVLAPQSLVVNTFTFKYLPSFPKHAIIISKDKEMEV